jgi:hypothetical protein
MQGRPDFQALKAIRVRLAQLWALGSFDHLAM